MGKINKNNVENILKLTPVQEGMLFHYLAEPKSLMYHTQLVLELEGRVDIVSLTDVWNKIVEKHGMLRTLFRWEGLNNPVQITLKTHRLPVRFFNLSQVHPSGREREYAAILKEDSSDTFSLDAVPFRVTLCSIDEQHHYLIITHHHILYDGWSTYILLKDFFRFYGMNPAEVAIAPDRVTYKDYVTLLIESDKKKEEAYWTDSLGGMDAGSNRFISAGNNSTKSQLVDERVCVNGRLHKRIEDFVKEKKVFLSSFLYFVYGALLKVYQGTDKIVIGYTLSSRGAGERSFEDTVGLFINTLPLSMDFSADKKIRDVMEAITRTLGEHREVSTTPLVDIRKYCGGRGDLFQSIVVLENYPADIKGLQNSALKINSFTSRESSNYPLTVGIELYDTMEITFSYDEAVVDPVLAGRLGRDFLFMLEAVLDNYTGTCGELDLLGGQEKVLILEEFNRVESAPDVSLPLFRYFEEAACARPAETALSTASGKMDYKTLNATANAVAQMLLAQGLEPGSRIPLFMANSFGAVAAMLGVSKMGGCYVPVDVSIPAERIRYIIEDCQAACVISGGTHAGELKRVFRGKIIDLSLAGLPEDAENPGVGVDMDDACYIIYTSGTSGRPKGVVVSHKNAVSYVRCFAEKFSVNSEDVVLQQASLAFDTSVEEIFPALIKGGEVALMDRDKIFDIHEVHQFIRRRNVSIVSCSPLMLNEFNKLERLESVRLFISGGDVLRKEYIDHLIRNSAVYNTYGPTEATVCASFYNCADADPAATGIPIGKPFGNARIYILDTRGRPVPAGVPGELCIAGLGVSGGYLNLPELTAEKFVTGLIDGERLYKTGDLARWLPGGDLDFMGRIDNQVNIRGYRIELGEIETTLRNIKGIEDAVVLLQDHDDSRKRICAYYKAAGTPEPEHVKQELSRFLPGYMLPSKIERVRDIPLTLSGKVDHKKLAGMRITRREIPSGEGVNDFEKRLLCIWQEVLGKEEIGLDENYFDAGGNSISLMQLSGRIHKAFEKSVKIADLLQYTTIRRQAQLLSGKPGTKPGGESIRQAENHYRDVAVIGIGMRFPGSSDRHEFWDNLTSGVESIAALSEEDLDKAGVSRELQANPGYVKFQGVLEGLDSFDHEFFGYKPNEAAIMDPQIRVFHEITWEALEDAGYNPGKYDKPVGLFAGASPNLYWEKTAMFSETAARIGLFTSELYANKDYLSQLVSYKLGLRGPAISLYTACSSSLVAVHLAAQSLLRNECAMALAGGVTLVPLPDKSGYLYEDGMVFSDDGHCRTFDNRAKGFVPGKGAAVVVLKPLEEAVKDKDHIYAVIKGSAVNNDGDRKVGYNAPSVDGIADVISRALKVSGVEPESLSYMETHGAATKMGDLIEIEAAQKAFQTRERGYCAIGSVKTNVGHLDCTSGIAGFVKTALMLKHKTMPPSLNFGVPNTDIDFMDSPFYVGTETVKFPEQEQPLRACVNSIGQGGTNAHVILEAAPASRPQRPQRSAYLILVSAMTQESLENLTGKYIRFFKANPDLALPDVAYTLQAGRKHFRYRRYVCCSHLSEGIELLGKNAVAAAVGESRADKSLYFVFNHKAGNIFFENSDYFYADPLLKRELDKNILYADKIIFPGLMAYFNAGISAGAGNDNEAYNRIVDFIFLYSYAAMLISLGIKPSGMAGYGENEVIPLVLCGVISFEHALHILKDRGRGLVKYAENGAPPAIPFWSHATGSWVSGEVEPEGSVLPWQERPVDSVEPFMTAVAQKHEGWTGILDFCGESTLPGGITCLNPLAREQDPLNQIPALLWLRGYCIDWESFYSPGEVSRVSLPTYSFKKESFSVGSLIPETLPPGKEDSRRALSDWFYVPAWKQSFVPDPPRERGNSCVLILGEESGILPGLKRFLRQAGDKVFTVFPGDSFGVLADGSFRLDPAVRLHFQELVRNISQEGHQIDSIINCFPLPPGAAPRSREADDAQQKLFLSNVYMADALQECNILNPVKLLNVSCDLHRISGLERGVPQDSLFIGAAMVAAQEINNLSFQCLDLDAGAWGNESAVCGWIAKELRSHCGNPLTAYRGGIRWELDYQPMRLDESVKPEAGFKEQGVYLLVGGLGGVGFHLARYLLEKYHARLIITGRTELVSASLPAPAEAGVARKKKKWDALLALGGECTYLAAGVHNSAEMERVFAAIDEKYSSLDGVIFAPAASDASLFRSLHELTPRDARKQFEPKMQGVLVLDKLLENRKPGFCLLMSSISSIVGGLGFAAYSSANIFLDYFAGSKNGSETRWISVNWEGWDLENKETRFDYTRAAINDYFMSIPEGIEAMERVLAWQRNPRIIVSSVALRGRLEKWVYKNSLEGDQGAVGKQCNLKDLSLREIGEALATVVKDYFGFAEIKDNATFFDLGASSLDLIQLCLNIRKLFNISLTIVDLFRHSSVMALAEYLHALHTSGKPTDIKKTSDEELHKIKERKQKRLRKRRG